MQVQPMTSAHIDDILEMMKDFYASDAVATSGSREIFERDIAACIGDNPYLEGFVVMDNDEVAGYCMLAKSWSTEYGRSCIWIEDIYIRPGYRGQGYGRTVMGHVKSKYPDSLLRLEASANNREAVRLYRRLGFTDVSSYLELKKLPSC